MSDIQSFIQEARASVGFFKNASPEQALTYACEFIAEREIATRTFLSHDIQSWVEDICHREDLDVPTIVFARASKSSLASAAIGDNAMCIRGAHTTAATVIHELAHLSVGFEGHGVLFRDELVRLSRAYLSVEYAAFLHALCGGCGLEMAPWPASASRR